jgi:NitT/TauT family transport system substrate-binding protein
MLHASWAGSVRGTVAALCLTLSACAQATPPAPTAGPAATAAPAPTATTAAAAAAKPTAAAQTAATSAPQAATAQQTPKSLGKITISEPSASLGFSPMLIAEKTGLFKEQGLEDEIVYAGSGSKATAAVIGRSADIGATSLGDIIGAIDEGQDIKIIAGLVTRPTGAIVINKSVAARLGIDQNTPIEQRVQAFKGLKFAVSTPGSGTDTQLRYVLSLYGLDTERDVEILTTGSVAASLATYAQGKADAASLSAPSAEEAVVKDDGLMIVNLAAGDVPSLNQQVDTGVWATSSWLKDNPDKAVAVVAAVWKALDYSHKSNAEAGELVRKEAWAETDKEVFDLAWQRYTPAMATTPELALPYVQSLLQYREVTEGKKATFPADQAFTNDSVQKAKALLGK